MDLKSSQFTLARMLHATVWFAVAAALFGLMSREESPSQSWGDRGWLMPVMLVAIGIGGGVLFGWRAMETSFGRSVASLYCGAASIFLQYFSGKFALLAGLSLVSKEEETAHFFAAVADAFGSSAYLFALAAVVLAIHALRVRRGYTPIAALICAAFSILFMFLTV
jgi:hypothetical protein